MCGGFVPRLKKRTGEAELRQYLLATAVEFRELYAERLREAAEAFDEPVNQLTRGEAFRLYGWELPDGHPARLIYGINAALVLTEDDVLMPTES
jgi:hypothetical protein